MKKRWKAGKNWLDCGATKSCVSMGLESDLSARKENGMKKKGKPKKEVTKMPMPGMPPKKMPKKGR